MLIIYGHVSVFILSHTAVYVNEALANFDYMLL